MGDAFGTSADVVWSPGADRLSGSGISRFIDWLNHHRGLTFGSYDELWRWSTSDLAGFWGAVYEYAEVMADGDPSQVLDTPPQQVAGARWFPKLRLNYAEHALRAGHDSAIALIAHDETGRTVRYTRSELRSAVGSVAATFQRLGVRAGDRVAGLLPNTPHAVIALLATASLGAVWTSCSPDFGARGVVDRFAQVEPVVLVAVDSYSYGGKVIDVRPTVAALVKDLPSLRHVVLVPGVLGELPVAGAAGVSPHVTPLTWTDLLAEPCEPRFTRVPFDHPLWVLYSSGTTGLPKAIVHGHGGILLEHLKALKLHCDLGPDDVFFWFSTTGWMMWNFLVSGLLTGSTVVLYDGSPGFPGLDTLWALAQDCGVTLFGTSAPYLTACQRAGIRPATNHDLSRLRTIGSTGAPLPPEAFDWISREVGREVLIGSLSGGTDVCTAFVGPASVLPVRRGEIQCRMLGAKVEAYNESGRPVIAEVGELVLTAPLPCMPVSFWGDPYGHKLHEAYFADFPGVWRHGDWVRITRDGGVVISGRSDSTLNRGGVRLGTAEFYRVIEDLPEIADSLVVDLSRPGNDGELVLFVVPEAPSRLDEELRQRVRKLLRSELSPRHVPDRIIEVTAIPRTLNGKKCEVPVKRILLGTPVDLAVSRGALRDPAALEPFVALAAAT